MVRKNFKGIFLSEWYTMKVLFIAVLVMVISVQIGVMASVAGTGSVPIGLSTMPCGFGVVLLSTAFAYDNFKSCGTFRKSMPYSDRDIVLARYIPPTVVTIIALVMTPLMLTLGGEIHGSYCNGFVEQAAFMTLINVVYSALPVIFFYPMFYKFGYQKMQLAYGLLSGMLMITSGAAMAVTASSVDEIEQNDETFLFAIPVPVCAVIIVVLAALYIVSFKVSVKEYSKRDD